MKIYDNAERAVLLAEIVKAMAHPIRLQIIAILCERNEKVGRLAECLQVSQAIISQQLRILRMSGLVEATRENGFAWYQLAEPQLKKMIQCMEKCSTH